MKVRDDKILIQVTCLLLAVVLWVFVMGERNPKIDKDIVSIPVKIRNELALEDTGLSLINKDEDSYNIDLKVSGYRNDLININKEDIHAFIDVLGYSEGANKVPVEIELPEGIEIKEYSPKQILCNMEAIITKTLDIEVEYEGTYSNDYYLSDSVINPTSILVKGPRSIVNSASKAVVSVNLNGDTETFSKNVPVSILSDTGNELSLTLNPNIVEVIVHILPTKTVELVPEVIGEPLEGYKVTNISIEPKYIKIAAKYSLINNINELITEPIDITGAFYTITRSQNIINNNGFIIIDGTSNPKIRIQIEKIIQKDFIYSNSDINYINVPEGYLVNTENADEEFIVVTVDGVSSMINQLSKDDIYLTADLTECKEGMNEVLIDAKSNIDLESVEINPEIINIQIVKEEITETIETTE